MGGTGVCFFLWINRDADGLYVTRTAAYDIGRATTATGRVRVSVVVVCCVFGVYDGGF